MTTDKNEEIMEKEFDRLYDLSVKECYEDESEFDNNIYIDNVVRYIKVTYPYIDDDYNIRSYAEAFVEKKQKQLWEVE
jgi:hypothetical protein